MFLLDVVLVLVVEDGDVILDLAVEKLEVLGFLLQLLGKDLGAFYLFEVLFNGELRRVLKDLYFGYNHT